MSLKSFSKVVQVASVASLIGTGARALPYDTGTDMGSPGAPGIALQKPNKGGTDWSTKVARSESDWVQILGAIREVETGGKPNRGVGTKGDNGKALGPFQIHKIYWQDAVDYDKSIGGKYEDCLNDYDYSVKVVRAYMKRYSRGKDLTYEQIARYHNGGPNIYKKKGTKPWDNTTEYWEKVKKSLK